MTTMTSPRTLTETEYRALPVGLNVGRIADGSGMAVRPALEFYTALDALLADADGGQPTLGAFDALLQAADDTLRRGDPFAGLDPRKAKPAEVAERARQAALLSLLDTVGGADSCGRALNRVTEWVRPAVEDAFTKRADQTITNLRAAFDSHVGVLTEAHEAGITTSMTPEDIAATASPEQVDAWRRIGPAVAELDRLAALRVRVHHLLDWEHESRIPALRDDTRVMACFLTDTDADQRADALALYGGTTETVLVASSIPSNGPAVKKVARPRTGGPWLALVAAGYQLSLRTPSETADDLDD